MTWLAFGRTEPSVKIYFFLFLFLDGFHWSYSDSEGTGPGFWGTEFEVSISYYTFVLKV